MIYICICKSIYLYFIDYINSININLNGKIILYNSVNDIIEIMTLKKSIIIFVFKIPDFITNIETYNNIFLLNTEQLTDNSNLNYIKNLPKNIHLIDYSKENIDILNKNNIFNVIYFPYIYNKKEILNLDKKNIICSIRPTNTPRRKIFFTNFNSTNNIKINSINGWNEERDNKLFTHKILLNISAKDNYNIFETIRCYRCLFNKMIIISEIKYNIELIDYSQHILFAELKDIPNLINDVINNYEYYYKLLDLDNINIHLNDKLINKKILSDKIIN